MKRWMILISLRLILGAVTTVGVSVLLIAFTPDPASWDRFGRLAGDIDVVFPDGAVWRVDVYQAPISAAIISQRQWPANESSKVRVRELTTPEERMHFGEAEYRYEITNEFGGLIKTFGDVIWSDELAEVAPAWTRFHEAKGFEWSIERTWGFPAYATVQRDRLPAIRLQQSVYADAPLRPLQLRPIWPGFLIDALFYALIWFGLILGFTSAKRAIRRRRGRCPMCGYDLRGDHAAGCSECGWNRAKEAAP